VPAPRTWPFLAVLRAGQGQKVKSQGHKVTQRISSKDAITRQWMAISCAAKCDIRFFKYVFLYILVYATFRHFKNRYCLRDDVSNLRVFYGVLMK